MFLLKGYHSKIQNLHFKIIGNLPILTFKTTIKGPISKCMNEDLTEPTKVCPDSMDLIDETIYYFRANVFLSKFEIKNEIDRLLVYLTLYILECIKLINRTCVTKKQAELAMINFSKNRIWMNEESNVLNFIYKKPDSSTESGNMLVRAI